jgi:hypothetical protein
VKGRTHEIELWSVDHRYNAFTGEAERAFAAGGVVYVMIYLLALSGLQGVLNLVADGGFLFCTLLAVWQLSTRLMSQAAA